MQQAAMLGQREQELAEEAAIRGVHASSLDPFSSHDVFPQFLLKL
jgi:hypothetical protein